MATEEQPVRQAARFSPPVLAAVYMTAAAFGFSVMNVAIREMSYDLDPLQIVFLRNLFATITMLPFFISHGFGALRTMKLSLYLWRAIIGLFSMILWFASLALLPLADAVALNFTVPLFATIGAALFLGEVVRVRRWTATAIGFLGVLIILRPGFQEISLAMLLPVVAAFFMATSALIVKQLSRTESAGTIVLFMNLLLTPLSLGPALFVWQWPSAVVWGLAAFVGLTGAIAHLAFTRAYAQADASAVMPFDYMRLPFAALLAFMFFGELPDAWTWVGAAVIAGSAIYIAQREARLARVRPVRAVASRALQGRHD